MECLPATTSTGEPPPVETCVYPETIRPGDSEGGRLTAPASGYYSYRCTRIGGATMTATLTAASSAKWIWSR